MGDKLRFEDFFQEHFIIVVRYINKRISNYQNAEDMAMDVFLACYKHYNEFDENKASIKTWLYVIVNNRLKNYYRNRKEIVELNEDVHKYEGFEQDLLYIESLKAIRTHLAKAIKMLPELNRKIVINKYFGDKSSVELADMFHLSSGNVRVILTRSLKKIQTYFIENGIEWEV